MKPISCFTAVMLAALSVVSIDASAGQFKKPTYYYAGSLPFKVVSADFNNDGNADLAFGDWLSSQLVVLLGNGNGTFQKLLTFAVGSPGGLAIGDFNEDNIPDLAVVESGGTGDGALAIFLGDGQGGFKLFSSYQIGVESGNVAVADFNGDGHLDVAVSNLGFEGNGSSVMTFFGNGHGKFGHRRTYKPGNGPAGIAAGNLNGDHFPDLAVTLAGDGSVAVLMNDGTGHFKKPVTYSAGGGEVVDVKISDLRHDGRNDLVIANGSLSAVGVLLNRGDGVFGPVTLYPTHCDVEALTVADFNLDGKLDVAVAAQAGNSAFMYGKGNGTFGSPVPIKDAYGNNNYGGFSIASGDFNNDGAPDLAIPIENAGKVAIMLNAQ